ncbi:MAG: tRNA uridine-5-carboxymethylaminomethyl(34) synthesis GTPase MnmE [Acidobacteriota bacterium]
MPDQSETIVAISTPPGRGGISVVRTSGPLAAAVVSRCLRPPTPALQENPRRALLRDFHDASGRVLDRVIVTFFQKPASYTGQDVVEISCHGSVPVTAAIVRTLLDLGMRLATPGEFTLRAFLNGKVDLAQAEAVRDLVNSRTEYQARQAREQLEGTLSRRLEPLRTELVRIISHLETALEFVEDEVSPEGRDSLLAALDAVESRLDELESGFQFGRWLQEGAELTIVGRPNAGKSSLFNALLRDERAIVTEIPGTTRDALRETITLAGIPAHLVDTAGIRESDDRLEKAGMEKSLEYVRRSDVVCFVVDGSAPFSADDRRIWEAVKDLPVVVAVNKLDLGCRVEIPEGVAAAALDVVQVSALFGTRVEELRQSLARVLGRDRPGEGDSVIVSNLRQQDCLRRAKARLRKGRKAWQQGLSEEFVLYDLRKSLEAIGEVTGATDVEEILDAIFSTFCIGK